MLMNSCLYYKNIIIINDTYVVINVRLLMTLGKAIGREPITCLGRVFNYKLGCFVDMYAFIYMDAHPHLELKTQPRFSPVS